MSQKQCGGPFPRPPTIAQFSDAPSIHEAPESSSKDGQNSVEECKVHYSLNPDEQLMAAQVRIAKLEAALSALGEEDLRQWD